MGNQFHTLAVKTIKRETINTVSIIFNIPAHLQDAFSYQAGQYLTIKKEIGGEEVRRSYSISSYTSTDPELQISCKMIPGGKMSTFLFQEVGVDDLLEVMQPDGRFLLKRGTAPLVLFAAGSGITPIMSILKKALSEEQRTVNLFYGNRSTEEIIYKEELESLQAEYTDRLLIQHFLSSNGERLDSQRSKNLLQGIAASAQAEYYICGPLGMIEAVKEGLESANIPEDQIHIEYFASPKTESSAEAVDATTEVVEGAVNDVILILNEEEHHVSLNNGETVLEAGNRIGIDPPFSCQSGVCTTCRAKVLSGKVEMENNFGLSQEEEDEGFVLTCISTPKSPGVKISWDED